nr:DUF4118 domain-containing protein [Pseudoroseomonas vastitatis]
MALYFFVPPFYSFAIPNAETAISVALFLGSGLFIALVREALHVAYVEAEQAHAEAAAAQQAAEDAIHERDLLLHRQLHGLARTYGVEAAQGLNKMACQRDLAEQYLL